MDSYDVYNENSNDRSKNRNLDNSVHKIEMQTFEPSALTKTPSFNKEFDEL